MVASYGREDSRVEGSVLAQGAGGQGGCRAGNGAGGELERPAGVRSSGDRGRGGGCCCQGRKVESKAHVAIRDKLDSLAAEVQDSLGHAAKLARVAQWDQPVGQLVQKVCKDQKVQLVLPDHKETKEFRANLGILGVLAQLDMLGHKEWKEIPVLQDLGVH